MSATGTSFTRWTAAVLLITGVFGTTARPKVITVDDNGQADFRTIQAAIDAAEQGDTVSVAPGTYRENIALRDGIHLTGSGPEVTIVDASGRGDVVDARANDAAICGFTLRNSGESGSPHMNCGVYLEGNFAPVVKGNVIVGNRIGIGAWYGAHPDIRNNVIENNTDGLYLYGSQESPTDPQIVNNTIVGNQTDGIVLREWVSPALTNNIIVGHATVINHNYVRGTPLLNYNNVWDNDVDYLRDGSIDERLAGPGSTSVDPGFAKMGYWADANDPNVPVADPEGHNVVWMAGDYHLKSQAGRYDPNSRTWVLDDVTSPCIDAGEPNSPVGFEPAPNGGRINLGAYGGTAKASKSPSHRHARYGGGTGEPGNPYQIYTPEHLNTIGTESNDWGRQFRIMADLDLSALDGKDGRPGFNIIAPDADPVKVLFQGTPFTGLFDGNGHTISHLTASGGESVGLFGRLGQGARVKNLGIVDVNITGSGDEVGGLAGYNEGIVANCYSSGKVKGRYSVGGLVGWNQGGTLIHCYSRAAVTGRSYIGGLVAYAVQGEVTQCYSSGAVTGEHDVGGLVGYDRSATVKDSFWDTQSSGQATSEGGTGKTTAQMQRAQTFLDAGWDFVGEPQNGTADIWWIRDGKDYPRLRWELIQELGVQSAPYPQQVDGRGREPAPPSPA